MAKRDIDTASRETALTAKVSRRTVAKVAAAAPVVAAAGPLHTALAAPAVRPETRVRFQDKTKISFWSHTHPPMVDQNEKMIASFMEANPDIEVDYQIIPNNNFAEKMLTSMSTGTGPDIINMDDNAMRSIYISKGLVSEVDPAALGYTSLDELKAAYIPTAFEGATMDGKIYGLPSEFNVTAFAINTAAFAEAGLDPESPPKTWEEVGTMGQKLVVKDGDTITRRGFDFLYLHSGWYQTQFGTLLQQTGGRVVSEDGTKAVVNEPEGVAALQIWFDMVYTYKVADPNVATRESTNPYQDFIDGKVAMTLFNPWGMGLVTEDSAVFDNYSIVPLPQVDPAKPVDPLYAYYWSLNSQSKNKEAAFKLIAHLASDPGDWLANVDFIQPKKGWTTSPAAAEFAFSDVWASEMEQGKFLSTSPNFQQINEIMKSAIESCILSQVPPQEALDQAADQINGVLGG
ncbi:MAG TPA: ABC transporter substrate-binding protein [Thermomicrobiales bacterium]|nr:ABC transporter substrate-binding protein [Thermomicrobiales bacterium]